MRCVVCATGPALIHSVMEVGDGYEPAEVADVDAVLVAVDEEAVAEEAGAAVSDQAVALHLAHAQTAVLHSAAIAGQCVT